MVELRNKIRYVCVVVVGTNWIMYVIKHEVRFSLAKWVFSTSYIFGISQNVLHPDIKFEILKIEDLFMSRGLSALYIHIHTDNKQVIILISIFALYSRPIDNNMRPIFLGSTSNGLGLES